jgi:hypothetical protein
MDQQKAHQRGTARHLDILARQLLQAGDLCDDVSLDLNGRLP